MKLDQLLQDVEAKSFGDGTTPDISGIAYDSRAVRPGSVFVAIRGEAADGNDFVPEALANGAAAIVSENPAARSVPWFQVRSARSALAALAANYYGHPTRDLSLVGLTGTNGKTTTSYIVESILKAAGHGVALVGTIDHRGPGFGHSAVRTTPEAPDLERMFRDAVRAGCRHAVMEVSSHAIALGRAEQLDFDVVGFTNLSGDHLDFHGGMNEYFETKKRLFLGLMGKAPEAAVLNRDDAKFEELRGAGNSRVLSYAIDQDADVSPLHYAFEWDGTDVELRTPVGDIRMRSSLVGRPNLYNLACATAIAIALEVPTAAIVKGVAGLDFVPGRFECVDRGQPFRVVVDYAHSDDALEKVLTAAREVTGGRLIVVFGCGGDRDREKRSRMGEVAGRLADIAVVTSDNPRGEDPDQIMRMVEEGLVGGTATWECEPDRREAISRAFAKAGSDDTVLIAGKGHETYQLVRDRVIPFDDRLVAGELLDGLEARRDR